MSKEILLTQGKVAVVDDEDFGLLNSFKWYAKESGVGWYAVKKEKLNWSSCKGLQKSARSKRSRRTIRMHNMIMRPPKGFVVHHKDRSDENRLDNRRSNLELCTPSENLELGRKKGLDERNAADNQRTEE